MRLINRGIQQSPVARQACDIKLAIHHTPELHGKEYKVQPDAIYVDPSKTNLRPKSSTGKTLFLRPSWPITTLKGIRQSRQERRRPK
ncbi:TPA: hypothetical protein ACNUZQ_000917 [Citrobacter braakii]